MTLNNFLVTCGPASGQGPSSAQTPRRANSSAWLPRSTIWPVWTTRMWSYRESSKVGGDNETLSHDLGEARRIARWDEQLGVNDRAGLVQDQPRAGKKGAGDGNELLLADADAAAGSPLTCVW